MSEFEIKQEFVNEQGNQIEMSVTYDDRGVTVTASGPKSSVEHTWTPLEAKVLHFLLDPQFAAGQIRRMTT